MNIGETAKASGVKAKMIRYYESIGLVTARGRTDGGYRIYGDNDVHVLRFIRHARHLGFSVEQIRHLLTLWQDRGRASSAVKAIASEHIRELDQRISELRAMRDTLVFLAEHCAGNARPDCPILDELCSPEFSQANDHARNHMFE
jgi:Cu(I)-responsive transcriptional regulator